MCVSPQGIPNLKIPPKKGRQTIVVATSPFLKNAPHETYIHH